MSSIPSSHRHSQALVVLILVLLPTVVGCSIQVGSTVQARQFYVLNPSSSEFSVSQPLGARLAIRRPEADRFIDSHRILYSSSPIERRYYQFASWIDTPPDYLARILKRKVEESRLFTTVTIGDEAASNYVIVSEIRDFYHRTADTPGTVEITIVAELIRTQDEHSLGQATFIESIPVASYDASGAVEAFQRGLNAAADKILFWLKTALSKPQP